ncbi:Protein NRDE2 [Penicillium rolfsii]|nr:Protein NRDE2 [Penicillium rolfsii]
MESSGSQFKDKTPVPTFSSFKPPPAPPEADRSASKKHRHEHHSRSTRQILERDRRDSASRRPQSARHHRPHSPSSGHRSSREHERSRHPTSHEKSTRGKGETPSSAIKSGSRDLQAPRKLERSRDRTSFDEPGHEKVIALQSANESASGDLAHLKSHELYFVDTKGDRSILKYGTAHRYDTPLYHRSGAGRVLGLSPHLIIDRGYVDDTIILRDTSNTSRNAKFSGPLSGPVQQPTQLYRLKQDANPPSTKELEYHTISLDHASRNQSGDHVVEDDSNDEHHAYRSIHGKAKAEDVHPKGMEPISGEDGHLGDREVKLEAERQALEKTLWRTLKDDPKDVAAWLQVIDLQYALILGPGEDDRPLTSAERQTVARTRLGLYEKALASCGDTVHKDLFLLGRLQEGGQLWDRTKLWEEWDKALKDNPESTSLHLMHLNLRQTDFQDFALEDCKSLLVNYIKRIDGDPNASGICQVQQYLFLRLTLLLREAGYTELAVGFWQAALDFACFRPDAHLQGDRDQAISQFGKYWDSEVARLGEVNGQGWRGEKSRVDPVSRELGAHIDLSFLFSSWASSERNRIQNLKMPARSVDNYGADVDTAYSVVLVSDLRDILSPFWHTTASEGIINAFLYFCHLPHLTTPTNTQTSRLWNGDNFLRNEFMDNLKSQISDWLPSEVDDPSHFSSSLFSFPVVNFLHSTETLFASANWFSSLQSWSRAALCQSHSLDTDWVRRTLRSLVERFDQDDQLAEYALAVEYASDTQAGIAFGKELLRRRGFKLKISNATALMLCRSGEREVAYRLWSMAINDTNSREKDRLKCGPLWNIWAWEMLQQGDFTRASYLLHTLLRGTSDLVAFRAATDKKEGSPFEALRLENFLHQSREQALYHELPYEYVAWADCLALLRYVANNSLSNASLDASLDVYVTSRSFLDALSPEKEPFMNFTTELLLQAQAKLIYFHVSRNGQFKPRQLQLVLRRSLDLFPNNTMFLALSMWNEARFSRPDRILDPVIYIEPDRVARYQEAARASAFAAPVPPQQTPVYSHLFKIYRILCRPDFLGGTIYAARAAFEKAIGDRSNPYSPSTGKFEACSNITLWKIYILFELDRAHDIKAATDVFYRAIRACPWSKELVMLAFERLASEKDGPDFDKLRELYNLLDEKQLRVHVDIAKEIEDASARRAEAAAEADEWLKDLGANMEVVKMK